MGPSAKLKITSSSSVLSRRASTGYLTCQWNKIKWCILSHKKFSFRCPVFSLSFSFSNKYTAAAVGSIIFLHCEYKGPVRIIDGLLNLWMDVFIHTQTVNNTIVCASYTSIVFSVRWWWTARFTAAAALWEMWIK